MAFTGQRRREYDHQRYEENTEFLRVYKVEHGCVDCGYKEHHAGLEFDHILPRKYGTIAQLMGKSRKRILEEIARCELVCGTCHNIRSWNRAWYNK